MGLGRGILRCCVQTGGNRIRIRACYPRLSRRIADRQDARGSRLSPECGETKSILRARGRSSRLLASRAAGDGGSLGHSRLAGRWGFPGGR